MMPLMEQIRSSRGSGILMLLFALGMVWCGVVCGGDDEKCGVTLLQLGNNNLEAIAPAKEAPVTMFCILPTSAR